MERRWEGGIKGSGEERAVPDRPFIQGRWYQSGWVCNTRPPTHTHTHMLSLCLALSRRPTASLSFRFLDCRLSHIQDSEGELNLWSSTRPPIHLERPETEPELRVSLLFHHEFKSRILGYQTAGVLNGIVKMNNEVYLKHLKISFWLFFTTAASHYVSTQPRINKQYYIYAYL